MTQPTVSDNRVSNKLEALQSTVSQIGQLVNAPLPDREFRLRHEDAALDIVRAIRDEFAPKLHDIDNGGQVLVWLLDFAERVRASEAAIARAEGR